MTNRGYYHKELQQIELNGEYFATVQFKSVGAETKHMNINEDCAREIIEYLTRWLDSRN